MHYYQFNIADYRKDTAHLTPMEHYIYRQLIDWYYLDETPIPKKTQSVLRRLRLETENEPELSNVLLDFFEESENGWVHARIERDIAEYRAMLDRNKANGSKGGRPRKQAVAKTEKPKKTQSVSSGNPLETQNKGKPITNNQETITPPVSPPAAAEGEAKPSKRSRGCRIPDDFSLTEDREQVALSLGLSKAEAADQFDRFVDHWRAKSGRDAAKADWEATWRNWCRRSLDYRSTSANVTPFPTESRASLREFKGYA